MAMLTWNEEYTVSTLTKYDDGENIRKAKYDFYQTVARLYEENPEFKWKILIGKVRVGRHDIPVGDSKVETWRLVWSVRGDIDMLNAFFRKWKEIDDSPCRSWFVRREMPLNEVVKLMNIREKEMV